jgi:DNA invertase Pin-like site-specific DNA recombinase
MTSIAEIARWHARQAKDTTGAHRDFHTEAAKLLRDFAKRRAEHGRNITAALAKRKAQDKPLGRTRVPAEIEEAIRAALRAGGKGMQAIAREIGVGTGTVQRVKAEMAQKIPRGRSLVTSTAV